MLIMLDGGELHDIREYASSQDNDTGKVPWGVSERQLFRYMEQAWQVISDRAERRQDKIVARHLLTRRRLYAKAVEQGDLRLALHVQRDLAELEGAYPAKTPEAQPTQRGRIEEVVNNPELRKLLKEYEDWTPPMLTILEPEKPKAKEA
jgi:hypothetical protein